MICPLCSKEFIPLKKSQKYCSGKCRDNSYAHRASLKKSIEIRERLQKSKRICPVCSNEFVPHIRRQDQAYCSYKCLSKAMNKRAIETGNKKISWKKDYEKHKDAYKHRAKVHREMKRFGGLREEVLKRDGYKCVKCGDSERLEVHHIDSSGKHKENANNTLENLETLCAKCHGIQTNIDMGRYVEVEKEQIIDAINKTNTLREAAELLGITYPTLNYKKKQYKIYKSK